MKVLLVDDEENFRQILTSAFEKEGINVIEGKNGREGLDKAKQEKPDLILLDQMLTDITGNDVLAQLKSDYLTKDIPVMMISNFGHEALVKQAMEKGAVDYIYKYSVETKDIINKVKDLLKVAPAQQG